MVKILSVRPIVLLPIKCYYLFDRSTEPIELSKIGQKKRKDYKCDNIHSPCALVVGKIEHAREENGKSIPKHMTRIATAQSGCHHRHRKGDQAERVVIYSPISQPMKDVATTYEYGRKVYKDMRRDHNWKADCPAPIRQERVQNMEFHCRPKHNRKR